MKPINLINLEIKQIQEVFKKRGLASYRADQVVEWIYKKGVFDFKKMTNLPQSLRDELSSNFSVSPGEITFQQESKKDRSIKFLLKLEDDQVVESVYMPYVRRKTV